MTQFQAPLVLTGRILLAIMFVLGGYQKIGGFTGTQQYMEAFGVPGILLPLVILLELGGGLLIVVGFMTRWVSLAIAGFTLVAAAIFHSNFSDQMQVIMFLKNLGIAGGFLILAAHGAGAWSLDARRGEIAVPA
jgi:putative oxidoreductase